MSHPILRFLLSLRVSWSSSRAPFPPWRGYVGSSTVPSVSLRGPYPGSWEENEKGLLPRCTLVSLHPSTQDSPSSEDWNSESATPRTNVMDPKVERAGTSRSRLVQLETILELEMREDAFLHAFVRKQDLKLLPFLQAFLAARAHIVRLQPTVVTEP